MAIKSQESDWIGNSALLLSVALMFYGLYKIQDQVIYALNYWWQKVGVVMWGLLPLSLLLIATVVYLLTSKKPNNDLVEKVLKIISFSAPSLGLLGTVLGTVAGTSQFTLANGVEDLLEGVAALMQGLSIALLSTAWGTMLGIPAGILILLLERKNQLENQPKVALEIL